MPEGIKKMTKEKKKSPQKPLKGKRWVDSTGSPVNREAVCFTVWLTMKPNADDKDRAKALRGACNGAWKGATTKVEWVEVEYDVTP
jgi:hypothetical protein